jgi:hypothetical protein
MCGIDARARRGEGEPSAIGRVSGARVVSNVDANGAAFPPFRSQNGSAAGLVMLNDGS